MLLQSREYLCCDHFQLFLRIALLSGRKTSAFAHVLNSYLNLITLRVSHIAKKLLIVSLVRTQQRNMCLGRTLIN